MDFGSRDLRLPPRNDEEGKGADRGRKDDPDRPQDRGHRMQSHPAKPQQCGNVERGDDRPERPDEGLSNEP